MSRNIKMTGDHAHYVEKRSTATPDDGREIVMVGDHVLYEEIAAAESPHFPMAGNEDEGRRLYRLLTENQFIARDTSLACWLYTMGYSTEQPPGLKPIEWQKNVQLAQVMLLGVYADKIEKKEMTKAAMKTIAERCFTKNGKPLRLAKFKAELSTDNDLLENFFRPNPT